MFRHQLLRAFSPPPGLLLRCLDLIRNLGFDVFAFPSPCHIASVPHRDARVCNYGWKVSTKVITRSPRAAAEVPVMPEELPRLSCAQPRVPDARRKIPGIENPRRGRSSGFAKASDHYYILRENK